MLCHLHLRTMRNKLIKCIKMYRTFPQDKGVRGVGVEGLLFIHTGLPQLREIRLCGFENKNKLVKRSFLCGPANKHLTYSFSTHCWIHVIVFLPGGGGGEGDGGSLTCQQVMLAIMLIAHLFSLAGGDSLSWLINGGHYLNIRVRSPCQPTFLSSPFLSGIWIYGSGSGIKKKIHSRGAGKYFSQLGRLLGSCHRLRDLTLTFSGQWHFTKAVLNCFNI